IRPLLGSASQRVWGCASLPSPSRPSQGRSPPPPPLSPPPRTAFASPGIPGRAPVASDAPALSAPPANPDAGGSAVAAGPAPPPRRAPQAHPPDPPGTPTRRTRTAGPSTPSRPPLSPTDAGTVAPAAHR